MNPDNIDNQELKKKLIYEIQAFLWEFEQGNYSRSTMGEILLRFEGSFLKDGEAIGGEIKTHIESMLKGCHLYAEGLEVSLRLIKDLECLQKDLER